MAQSHINMTIHGNIVNEPQVKKIGNANAITFSVAVQTNERDTMAQDNNTFLTNYFEVTYYPSPNDSFMNLAQKGTEIILNGKGWMYNYHSNRDNCVKSGLKFRASSYVLGARTKAQAQTNRRAAAPAPAPAYDMEDDYANI